MSGTQLLPSERTTLPLLPLRDVVVFPHMVIPLFVGRPKSIKALEVAMEGGKHIMLVAQKTAAKDEPTEKDMYEVGCIANILQMLKLPDGTVKVLVEGLQRAKTLTIEEQETQFSCEVMPLEPDHADNAETEALRRAIVSQFDQYVKLNKKIPPEILTSLSGSTKQGAWPIRSRRTCRSSSTRSSTSSKCSRWWSGSSICWRSSKPRSTFCRSRSAFVAA
jgi:ATP-dependent Lon protease